MDIETITLVAAIIAAVTSIGNIFFSYLSASSLERKKWENVRENERRRNLRNALEAFAKEIAEAIWHANWLLWYPVNDPKGFSDKKILEYNEAAATLLPRLLSTRVLVSAHDKDIYIELTALANRFYRLDGKIAKASAKYRSSPELGIEELVPLYNEAKTVHAEIGEKFAEILSS